MTDSNNRPQKGSRISKRTMLIAGAVTLAVLLVAGGVAAVLAANRASAPTAVPAAGGVSSQSASGSIAATGGASPAVTATATAATGEAGVATDTAQGGSKTTTQPKATRPGKAGLETLKPGQWRLYGSRVIAGGTEMKSNGSTDVQGIIIDCEALTKSGGGYAHATVELAFSATGPASGSGGPWRLFGTWVLSPDNGAGDNQHYGQGVEGGLSGRSTVRPPVKSGKLAAGFRPIGAYRPKSAGGVIEGGSFAGNAMFEGVLFLPSVATPPPS